MATAETPGAYWGCHHVVVPDLMFVCGLAALVPETEKRSLFSMRVCYEVSFEPPSSAVGVKLVGLGLRSRANFQLILLRRRLLLEHFSCDLSSSLF